LNSNCNELEELQVQLQAANDRCEQLASEVTQMETYWQMCQTIVKKKHEHIKELEFQLQTVGDRYERRLQENQDEVENKDKRIRELELQVQRANDQCEELRGALEAKNEQIEIICGDLDPTVQKKVECINESQVQEELANAYHEELTKLQQMREGCHPVAQAQTHQHGVSPHWVCVGNIWVPQEAQETSTTGS